MNTTTINELRRFYASAMIKLRTISVLCAIFAFSPSSQAETVQADGLQKKGAVFFDLHGVAYIEASNEPDAYFIQGWTHARDRFWQMEVNRMDAMGRLAELYGERRLGSDAKRRLMRFPETCRRIYEEMPGDFRESAEAYASGVNAFLKTFDEKPPYPFDRLKFYDGYKPEPWKPEDSLCIFRAVGWSLSGFGEAEKDFDKIVTYLGQEAFETLLPNGSAAGVSTMQERGASVAVPMAGKKKKAALPLEFVPGLSITRGFYPEFASNNWAVSGSKTATGNPMLANDTHMGVDNPTFWYMNAVKAPGINVSGLSIPGAPGVALGFNERYAWGATVAAFDAVDIYKNRKTADGSGKYWHNKTETSPRLEKITLKYRDGDRLSEREAELRYTVHGPVIDESPVDYYSMRWTGMEPTKDYLFAVLAAKGKTLDDFKEALSHYRIGAQNFVYADTSGNIYYHAAGAVPLRRGVPYLPLDGSSDKHEWRGYVPFDALPHLENPPSGFVATANNMNVPKDSKYYIGRLFAAGFRAARITELLQSHDRITFDQMREWQADALAIDARTLKPYLTNDRVMALLPPDLLPFARDVRDWDDRMEGALTAPSVYTKWKTHFARQIIEDEMPAEAADELIRDESLFWLLRLDREGGLDRNWWDDRRTKDKTETSDDLAVRALGAAVEELRRVAGDDPSRWAWGELHTVGAGYEWPPNQEAPRPRDFGPVPWRGNYGTLDVGEFGLKGDRYPTSKIATCRFVAEMTPDGPRAVNMIAGGQSLDPSSPHYDDLFYMWARHEAIPVYLVDKFEGEKEREIEFVP